MGTAGPIRTDIPAEALRRSARQASNGRVACRLTALAQVLAGMRRGQAAHQAGMDRQTLRDWVIRCNAAGIDGLRDRPKSGRPPWLDHGQLAALKALVWRGPDPARDGVSTCGPWLSVGSCWRASASATPRTACSGCSTNSHRLWPSSDDILAACCAAWNALVDQAGRIRSLSTLDRATVSSSWRRHDSRSL